MLQPLLLALAGPAPLVADAPPAPASPASAPAEKPTPPPVVDALRARPAPPPTRPAPRQKLLALTLSAGVQYNSNIGVDDADFQVRKGDGSALLGAGVTLTPVATRRTTLRFSYSYDDARNFNLTDYDLAIHAAGAGFARRFGKLNAAVDYQYSHVILGDDAYLDMHLVSPSLSAFATRNLFLRGAFTWLRKDFVTANRLDARTAMLGADAYRFFARRKGYVALGVRGDDERTTGPEFAFRAIQASVRAQVPLRPLGKDARVRLGYAWQLRDYTAITPSIGARRHETRSTLNAALDVPLSPHLTLRPTARYIDRRSNVELYRYKEKSASLALAWKL